MPVIYNIRVGTPDTTHDSPAHMPGIKQGNSVGNYERQVGMLPRGRATSRRSTGINPGPKNPIDSRMPTLPPP